MTVLIVEDQPLLAGQLELLVEDLGHHALLPAANADDALNTAREQAPDLLLMDVNLEGDYDGIETAEKIRQFHNCPVIFITSQDDDLTFRRAGRLGPINFLTKPVNELQLRRAIQLAVAQIDADATPGDAAITPTTSTIEDDHLYVRTGHKLHKVIFAEVTHVVADGRYCALHTAKARHLLRTTLTDLQQRLPATDFIKTHRSYLVNQSFVESVDLRDAEVILRGGGRVPLAKREREAFLQRIS